MRYADIQEMDLSNGLGIGVSLYTQGCPMRCPGCFNPETWDYDGGQFFGEEEQLKILNLISRPYIDRLTILGGEPLIDRNYFPLAKLILQAKRHNPCIKIWVYTGYTTDELLQKEADEKLGYLRFILSNIDVLVSGPFIQEQKDLTLAFRGSSNQRVIDMRDSDWESANFVDLVTN